jgi:hypothetical protein
MGIVRRDRGVEEGREQRQRPTDLILDPHVCGRVGRV